ncbi:MAG TPA: prepilin-type N-terminal cleavage/methylation domain-containing protein [Candidatus Saccharimonas sp.]|nr:prepilin-type N-terminal cleavage/methylation domain-containing protein [Candidatus Saccharimonas sp.]
MNKLVNKEAKGFTIIEVVLVLAIAGLIFLVVFLALPALQRSQRDTQRKSDLGRMMSQITAYTANNQGVLPTAWGSSSAFMTSYMKSGGQSFSDPQSNSDYAITSKSTAAAASGLTSGNIWVYPGFKCDSTVTDGSGVSSTGNTRQLAALIYQEQGGFYCQNN